MRTACVLAVLVTIPAVSATYYWNHNPILGTDNNFNRAWNWTSAQNGDGAWIESDKDDYFTLDTLVTLNGNWTWRDYDTDAGSGYSLTTNSDQLTVSARGQDLWNATNEFVAVSRTMNGDFDISVKVTSLFNSGTHAKAGLMVADDITALSSGGYAIVAVKPDGSVHFERDETTTAGELETATGLIAGTFPVWLRLVKYQGTFYGYYKRSVGAAWTLIEGPKTSQSTERYLSHVGIFANSNDSLETTTAVFDDFQGGGRMIATGHDLNMNGSGSGNDFSAVVSSDVTAASVDMQGYTGTLNFGSPNGLYATYYSDINFTGTATSRVDSMVDFDWGNGAPVPMPDSNGFSARWEGFVTPEYSGSYTFYTRSDDGTRLWVNGQLLVNKWQDQGATEWSGSITLVAGTAYPIIMDYYENAGGASAQLKWESGTNQPKALIPKRCLRGGKISVTGNFNFGANVTLAPDHGVIEFAGTSGTQNLYMRDATTTHPAIWHTGASTLTLNTFHLNTTQFYQSAGVLNLGNLDITTKTSGAMRGDFVIVNGTSTTFTGLQGRTITAQGNATFWGTAGNEINLNPAGAWTLAVTGQLNANYVNLGNCNASSAAGTAYKSSSSGGNSNWTVYGKTFYYNRNAVITGSTDFNASHNWGYAADGSGHRPPSAKDDHFESQALNSAWSVRDVDNHEQSGLWRLSGGQLILSARGGDIYGGTNQFMSVYRTDITGDFDVSVRVVSSSALKAGIIVADDLNSLGNGGYFALAKKQANGGECEFHRDESGTVGQFEVTSYGGSALAAPYLRLVKNGTQVSAFYKASLTAAWTQISTARTIQSMDANSQIGLFVTSGDGNTVASAVFDDFQAGTAMAGTDNELNLGGSGSGADANASLTGNMTVKAIDFTNYSGTFGFGTSTLSVNGGAANFGTTMSITAGTGALHFIGTSGNNTTFTPRSGQTFPDITHSGSSTTTVATSALSADDLYISAGNWNWGSSTLTHWVSSIDAANNPTMIFGTNTVNVYASKADFEFMNITANTGTLAFTGNTPGFTQWLTPKSGQTHPHIVHSGASPLELATNDLTCLSFSQSAGTLHLNNRNITTVSSGNFTLTNGDFFSLIDLDGRTITVAGNASFTGKSASNLLKMTAASNWTLAVTGSLTANYANIAFNTASVSAGVATNSSNGGNNTNWNLTAADFSDWKYSTRIHFNTTATGANVSGNVTGFPLLVRLTGTNFIFNQAHWEGDDIRFRDPDGTPLPYQIERWDEWNQAAEIWVRVPQVDGNSDRDYITMHWGNGAAGAGSNAAGTFTSGDGFTGVWHLNEDGNTNAGGYGDATGSGKTGTGTGLSGSSDVTGVIGVGTQFDGSSSYISVSGSYPTNTANRSLCGWGRLTNGGTGTMIVASYGSASTNNAFGILNWSSLKYGTWTYGAGDLSGNVNEDGDWHYLCATYDGTIVRNYVDGVYQNQATHALTTPAGNFKIGSRNADNAYKWKGIIDEVTMATSVRSADWIKLAYETQKPNSAVLVMPEVNLADWKYSTRVYLNTTASGANTTADVTGFPMLIRLTRANFDFAQAKSDGADVRFADSSGNLLPYELDRWDAANELAEVWVQVPTVKANNASQWFRMYWGNIYATSLSSGGAVFNGANSWGGVWHLDESSGSIYDATHNANTATGNGNVPNAVDAVVGKGTDFDGNTDWFNAPVSPSVDVSASDRLTVSAWVRRDGNGLGGSWEGILTRLEWTSGNHRAFALQHHATNGFTFQLNATGAGAQDVFLYSNNLATNGTWYHVAGVTDNSTMKIYVNGELKASQAYTAGIYSGPSTETRIGMTDDDGTTERQFFNGVIDEAAVHRVARSADWIKLSYESQKAGSSVVTLGEQSKDYSRSVRLNFNTTGSGGGANVPGNVTNIPMLVRLTASNFDFSAVREDGTDLRFIDRDGSGLYHEVVSWDKANRSASVWVKVPQVDGNSTADYITLYYGCATCSGNPWSASDSVWSTYAAVFHLQAPETKALDATKNNYTGEYQRAQTLGAGITSAMAPAFDGAADYIQTTVPTTPATRTLSAWINPRSSDNVTFIESVIDGDVAGQNGTGFGLDNGVIKTTLDNQFWTTTKAVTLNAWQHVALKFNATNAYVYWNGAKVDSVTYTQGAISSTTFRIGRSVANALYFDGLIQDVQVIDSYLSDDYVKLSYENQRAGSSVISSTGITTASFKASKVFRFNTTVSGANVSGDVFDFPLLIRLTDPAIIDSTNANAPDLRFLDADGVTWLDYQIERWDQSANKAEVWVKVPKVDGNNTSDFITMYYNEATGVTVPDAQCATCVFSTSQGYSSVYHLNNSLADAAGLYNGNNDGSNNQSNGLMAHGRNHDGIDATNHFWIPGLPVRDDFTISFWMKTTSNGRTGTQWHEGSGLVDGEMAGTVSDFGVALQDTGRIGFGTGGGTDQTVKSTVTVNSGNWTHVAVTRHRHTGAKAIYINGALNTTQTGSTASLSSPTSLDVGKIRATADATRGYTGDMDELQFHTVVRDANWIKLSYASQLASPTLFNPSSEDFNNSLKLTFNTTRTGANVMEDVENFPLLVRLTNATVIDAVRSSDYDIRFLDGDGKTWLQYQVERWDQDNNLAEVWVLVPKVDGNSDRDFITLWYNDKVDDAVPNGECASCVFSASNGFVAAWHMGENPAGSAPQLLDAGPNAYHGTVTGTVLAGQSIEGRVGKGIDFDAVDEGFTTTYTGNLTQRTYSAWIRPDAINSNRILEKGSADRFFIGSSPRVLFQSVHSTTTGDWTTDSGSIAQGTTVHLAVTYDNGSTSNQPIIYLNGSAAALTTTTAPSGTPSTNANSYRMGNRGSNDRGWEGLLDEVRISSVIRSADWVKLDYESQRPASENRFWNSRPGPNNKAVLTATPGEGAISLAWTNPTDSANADSVGIWLKYNGRPDSVGATGQTKVVTLPKADTTYAYPATYPGTYYFGLAVRNASGQWSPFTAQSIDTVQQMGSATMTDTIYLDSAIGNDANSCTAARNPATPKLTIMDADGCGDAANDTLVIRIMPGTYAGAGNLRADANAKPIVYTSFDNNSRAIFNGNESSTISGATRYYTLLAYGGVHLRNLDIKCAVNGYTGIYLYPENNISVDGLRIYNDGNLKHAMGIESQAGHNEVMIGNTVIHEATSVGIFHKLDNSYNIVNNVLIGTGAGKAIDIDIAPWAADATVANNIIVNWGTGIEAVSGSVGVCSNNLFHMVTSGSEVSGTTDSNRVSKEPRFYSTSPRDPNAFKLLPGSPAIDAGTTLYSGGTDPCDRRVNRDMFGTSRTAGGVPDIGIYEGSGYSPGAAGEFDTLTNTASGNTVIVKNGKWKLVWDMARGGGINAFYDMTVDSTVNLLATSSLLFDVRLDANLASTATSNTIVPYFKERTRARTVVVQRIAFNASMDLTVYYTVYPSGHIWIQSEIANLTASSLPLGVVQYSAKVGAAASVANSGSNLANISYKNGYGYLVRSARDVLLAVTQDLDGNGYFSETWTHTGSVAGSTDSVGFSTANLADPAVKMKRHHHFLLYLGSSSLDPARAATIAGDAANPSQVAMSAGTLLHEKSWQDRLGGHWNFDEGAGTSVKDRSINNTNNSSAFAAASWVAGRTGGALRFGTSSVVQVADADALEVRRHFAVSFWVKPNFNTMGANAFFVSKGTGTTDGWHFRRSTGQTLQFRVDGATVDSPALTADAWNHVVGICGGDGTLTLYLNGVLVGASTGLASMATNSSNLLFGMGSGDANAFAGDIDDVRVYHFGPGTANIQALYNRGFTQRSGHYHLRADNNNRVVALLNEGAAATRVQPAFEIDNWYGTKTPKYVYLNGVRLTPNVDFAVDSVVYGDVGQFGSNLWLQLNKTLTGADQTLFVDDNDSAGYLGAAGRMKSLTVSTVANDKIIFKNFADTVFGSASSGQWYLELDLNGWMAPTTFRFADSGFGQFNSWKTAAVSPGVSIGSAYQLAGIDNYSGRSLFHMKLDAAGSQDIFSGGIGYAGPANITYTIQDSSAVRMSFTLSQMTYAGDFNMTMTKRYTVYPNGRIFSNWVVNSTDADIPNLRIDWSVKNSGTPLSAWSTTDMDNNARIHHVKGGTGMHAMVGGFLSGRNVNNTYGSTSWISGASWFTQTSDSADVARWRLDMIDSMMNANDDPISFNFFTDLSRDHYIPSISDSLADDLQIPAAITALSAGSANPSDAMDYNLTPDGFAEGDGAYVYTAGSGLAHFKFVNTVTHFSPAFRIKSWTFSSIPEQIIVDNQHLVKDYHYNAYVNTAADELILQVNLRLVPGNHVFYISHKTGLAVSLNRFEAVGGEGVDTLLWTTESEFENLGFNVWRRKAAVQELPDSLFASTEAVAGAGIANALMESARAQAAAKAAAKASGSDTLSDTLSQHNLTVEQLASGGWERLNSKLIPGAKGGSSASTRDYTHVDNTAGFGVTYEYLLEAVDFNGVRVQYGPRRATPRNPLETALYPNYPNPFNPVTTLRFSLKAKSRVSLVVYDGKGRVVRTLLSPKKETLPGKYRLVWDARDDKGFEVPSGQYFYRFSAPGYHKTRKMMLVK